MNSEKHQMTGTLIGWFGSVFGCLAWMGAGAIKLWISGEHGSAMALGGCCGATGLAGVILWCKRERFGVFTALQLFLVLYMLLSAFAMLVIHVSGTSHYLDEIWKQVPFIFVVIPILMGLFHLLKRKYKGLHGNSINS